MSFNFNEIQNVHQDTHEDMEAMEIDGIKFAHDQGVIVVGMVGSRSKAKWKTFPRD